MVEFIVTLILMTSLGMIFYLIVRSLPRIHEEPAVMHKENFLDRWAASDIPERIDANFNSFLGKSLRRIKVYLLKIDNVLTDRIKKLKVENGKGGDSLPHFKRIAEGKSSDEK